jgi:hypothetical protein
MPRLIEHMMIANLSIALGLTRFGLNNYFFANFVRRLPAKARDIFSNVSDAYSMLKDLVIPTDFRSRLVGVCVLSAVLSFCGCVSGACLLLQRILVYHPDTHIIKTAGNLRKSIRIAG